MTAPDHLPQEPAARQTPHPGEDQPCRDHGGPEASSAEPQPGIPQSPIAPTLADLGEWELIRRLGAFAPAGQFADDAALLEPVGRGGDLVVNTDVLVEGIHFSEVTTGPADVGWRAAAANLSDLAAMGCTEVVGITVGLVAPATTAWRWVEGVYGGLREALRTYGGVLLGGDCSGGSQRILAITAIGRLPAPPELATALEPEAKRLIEAGSGRWGAIRRGDGRAGDALLCTGPHGLSRLGLALLLGELQLQPPPSGPWGDANLWAEGREPDLRERAITAHRHPVPRFDAVRVLNACRPAARPWRVAGCDSSDGLAAAVAAIAVASGCAARLDRTRLPLQPAMAALPQAQAWCLAGGEDFELVLALEPGWATALVAALPGSSLIGELMEGAPGALGWSDGGSWPGQGEGGDGAVCSGYSHFS